MIAAIGLIGGCASSPASHPAGGGQPGASSSSAAPLAPGARVMTCEQVPVDRIAGILGTPKLIYGTMMSSKPPICGLRPPREVGGTLVNLILGLPASNARFQSQVKYYRTSKAHFSVVVRNLSYGRMLYVTTSGSKNPAQTLMLYAHGYEYDVQVGILAKKPFSRTQLLRIAHMLSGD